MPLPDNDAFNLNFVQLVQGFKCLYDQSLPDYKSHEEQDKAWQNVASKCSAEVQDCKFRWKNLRGGLTRYIKKLKEKTNQGEIPRKQFYLWNAMQFVVPHLRSRDNSIHISYAFDPDEEELDETEILTVKNEVCRNGVETQKDVELCDGPHASNTTEENSKFISERGLKRKKQENVFDSFETIPVRPENVTDDILEIEKTENPDLQFFRSILPDMSLMNASQKRRFKIKVLELLEVFSHE